MRSPLGRFLSSPIWGVLTIAFIAIGAVMWTWQGMLMKSKGGWHFVSNELGAVQRREGCRVLIVENWSNTRDAIERLNRAPPVDGLQRNGDADAFLVQGGLIFGQSTLRYITATEAGARCLAPIRSLAESKRFEVQQVTLESLNRTEDQ